MVQDHCMFVYASKAERTAKHLIYLKGVYLKKIEHNHHFGVRLYHESESFKERVLLHESESVIDKWMEVLSHHCASYSFKEAYQQERILGSGRFSQVLSCKNKRTGERLAFKLVDKESLIPREKNFLLDEVQIINQLCHPNVIQFKEVYETKDQLIILMEQAEGTLETYLKAYRNVQPPEKEVAFIMKEILIGL